MDYRGYPPNGTYEDILAFLARAEDYRQRAKGVALPVKPRWGRVILEPAFNVVGSGLAAAARAIPAGLMLRLHDRLFRVVGRDSFFPFDEDAPGLAEAAELAGRLRAELGKTPALLGIMSHPPVNPEWLNLNVEMTRHVLWGLASIRRASCRPQMIVAVDPYGLDFLGLAEESFYAGFMGKYHLGIDRLALRRRWPSRFIVRRAAWPLMPWRLLRALSAGGEIGIVLAGGVPQTARMLYTSREFILTLRLHRDRRRTPGQVLRTLEDDADFRRFSTSTAVGKTLRRSAWRMMEAWIGARIAGEWDFDHAAGQEPDAYTGELSEGNRRALRVCAEALRCGTEFDPIFRSFPEEFSRETPYRARLFRVISARVSRRGFPVILVPFTHHFTSPSADRKARVRLSWGRPAVLPKTASTWKEAGSFAKTFVQANFP